MGDKTCTHPQIIYLFQFIPTLSFLIFKSNKVNKVRFANMHQGDHYW